MLTHFCVFLFIKVMSAALILPVINCKLLKVVPRRRDKNVRLLCLAALPELNVQTRVYVGVVVPEERTPLTPPPRPSSSLVFRASSCSAVMRAEAAN